MQQLFLPGLDVPATVVALAPVVAAGIVKLSFLVWPSAKLVFSKIIKNETAPFAPENWIAAS